MVPSPYNGLHIWVFFVVFVVALSVYFAFLSIFHCKEFCRMIYLKSVTGLLRSL